MEPVNNLEVTEKWIEHLVGRNWEIYWASESTDPNDQPQLNQQNCNPNAAVVECGDSEDDASMGNSLKRRKLDSDNFDGDVQSTDVSASSTTSKIEKQHIDGEQEVDNEDDWYAGHIKSFMGFEKNKNGRIINNRPIFQVLFVGDDELYEMCVQPDIVRPCSRTWIKRSLALLGETCHNNNKFSMKIPLENQLPLDTRRINDQDSLLEIHQSLNDELEPVQRLPCCNSLARKGTEVTLPEWSEIQRIREMIALIRQQIYLRSWLVPADDGDFIGQFPPSSPDEEQPPTESYISFLVDSLESAAQCCLWYYQCYVILCRIFHSEDFGGRKLTNSEVFKLFAEDGRQVLSKLVSLNPSFTALKRKRKNNSAQASISSPLTKSRRTKRRRPGNVVSEFLAEDETSRQTVVADIEDFRSAAFIKQLIERLGNQDQRWFSLAIGRMFRALSSYVVVPMSNWEQRSLFYLGETDVLSFQDPEGGSASDIGEDDSDNAPSGWITVADIEAVLEISRSDTVISKFECSDLATRLEDKLQDIAVFGKKCWEALHRVLDEDGSPHSPDNDEVLQSIQELIDTSNRKDSAIWNIDPLDGDKGLLNRDLLRAAAENRKWFLDLRHCESSRERVLFIEDLLSRHASLPDVPSILEKNGSRLGSASFNDRIRALGLLLSSNSALFQKHSETVKEMDGDIRQMRPRLNSMLSELQKIGAISVAEEMLITRMDLASWVDEAERVLASSIPKFTDIAGIKSGLNDAIQAETPKRRELASSLRSCTKADTVIRQFTQQELASSYEPVVEKIMSLYSKSSAWKERCDAIFAALRFHGNSVAWSANPNGPVKNTGMVDLKRIEDLLQDYACLGTSIETDFGSLKTAYADCVKWSENITNVVFSEDIPFGDILSSVIAANQPGGRPKGIIVFPTRQTLDTAVDILRWHGSAKLLVENRFVDMGAAYQLLLEGLDIVTLYGQCRKKSPEQFTVKTEQIRELIRARLDSRKPFRSLSKTKLESNQITEHLLLEMADKRRDRNEGLPLFALLLLAWRIEVENFAENVLSDEGTGDCSFDSAYALKAAMPVEEHLCCHEVDFFIHGPSHLLSNFLRLIEEAEKKTQKITDVISASKNVLRDCLRNPDEVRGHAAALKNNLTSIRRDATAGQQLILSKFLETKLDKEIKLFGWLTRAIQYPGVYRDEDDSSSNLSNNPSEDSKLERMPYDVLVKLNENTPEFISGLGDFTLVLLRLKELFEAANNWQQEVSSETLLSLRGAKRRAVPSGESDIDDGQQKIDLARVAELSASPVLKKIIMPREEAIRSMLENTKKFEVLLQDFMGKDYSGKYPDRIQLPSDNSLVDDDGRFILLRLTGSPLFIDLKSSLQNITSVANDVLADTPGKATFDWICKAVTWIEELSSYIDRDKIGHSQLSVEKSAVMDLLKMADAILLDVPDDLRRTLSKYGILVSTKKDGQLTVKSKKGAAHHSIGTTVIRWSPVLFEALKEDVTRTESWEARLKDLSQRCGDVDALQTTSVDACDVFKAHSLADEIAELLWETTELVVVPAKESVDAGVELERRLSSFIESHSTPKIEQDFANKALSEDSAIARDRYLFLDSLLERAAVVGEIPGPPIINENINDPLYRVAARNLISRGLEQGIIAIASDLDSSGDSIALCKLKAWEVEDALFRYLQSKNEDKASPKYREKVRSLKRALSDFCNSSLCLQVICGDLDPEKLVRMSSEQLASPKIRRDREAVEARAKEKTILTRSLAAKKEKKDDQDKKEEITEGEVKPKKENPTDGLFSIGEGERFEDRSNEERTEELATDLNCPSNGIKLGPPKSPTKSSKPVTRSSSRPPPPPSLAGSLRNQPIAPPIGNHVLNASGSDQFTLKAANTIFSVSFVPKSMLKPNVHAMLPDRLHDPGRTRVDSEFIEFLSGKSNSNHWDIYVLRLVPCSDLDAKEYQKFCRDFEGKQRIAMFKLPNKNKLFLITPKFYSEVDDVIPLEDDSSCTYGLLMLRSCD